MTRHLYLIAEDQNVYTLLLFASNSVGDELCRSHLFLRYNWHDTVLEREVNFSKSFECLIGVVNSCGYLNLANLFRDFYFDIDQSCETGFITFRKGDEYTFTFAFVENTSQYLLRISGKVNKSISANDNDLLGYLLSLNI